MTTIVNSPPGESGSVITLILGIVVTAVAVVLFFMYGLPAIRSMSAQQAEPTTINVELPTVTETPTEPQK